MTIVNPDGNLNPSAKNAANVNAEMIYSSIVGDHAIVNQQIIQRQREKGLFQLAEDDRDFTGRSQETETIEKILKSDAPTAMISAVSGMGGGGKSVLARHVGNRLKATFPDGQLYVDLLGQSETRRSPDSVLIDFLVDGFGEDPKHLPFELEGLRKLFHDRLNGQKILVVLDNAADAGQVEPLLPRVKGCGAIVTSREALTNLAGMTAENFVPLDVMTEPEAIELIQRLCPRKATDEAVVKRLVGLCGRLPLALTIVGTLLLQTVSLTLVEIVAELSQERSRLRVLKYRDARDVVDVRLDVEASFNLSYGRLSEGQRSLFEAVAVLRGRDFGRELAAVLVEQEEALVRKQLDQLVALQLVQWETGRYGFNNLVREFGRGKLGEEQEQGLTERALGWYVTMADQMEQQLLTDESVAVKLATQQFESEWQNLLQAISWSSEINENSSAISLFQDVQYYAALRGFRTHQLLEVGFQALTTSQTIGDRLGEANTLKAIGDVLQFLKQSQEALNRYETAIDIYRQVGDRLGEANTLKAIGDLEEDPKNGLKRFHQAMQIYQDIGDQYSQSRILVTSLAPAYLKLNQPDQANEAYEKALQYFEEINLEVGIEFCKEQLRNLNQQSVIPRSTITPKISDDRPPQKKKPFPLYPTIAALLLILGISYWQTLARQQTKPIGIENVK